MKQLLKFLPIVALSASSLMAVHPQYPNVPTEGPQPMMHCIAPQDDESALFDVADEDVGRPDERDDCDSGFAVFCAGDQDFDR